MAKKLKTKSELAQLVQEQLGVEGVTIEIHATPDDGGWTALSWSRVGNDTNIQVRVIAIVEELLQYYALLGRSIYETNICNSHIELTNPLPVTYRPEGPTVILRTIADAVNFMMTAAKAAGAQDKHPLVWSKAEDALVAAADDPSERNRREAWQAVLDLARATGHLA